MVPNMVLLKGSRLGAQNKTDSQTSTFSTVQWEELKRDDCRSGGQESYNSSEPEAKGSGGLYIKLLLQGLGRDWILYYTRDNSDMKQVNVFHYQLLIKKILNLTI